MRTQSTIEKKADKHKQRPRSQANTFPEKSLPTKASHDITNNLPSNTAAPSIAFSLIPAAATDIKPNTDWKTKFFLMGTILFAAGGVAAFFYYQQENNKKTSKQPKKPNNTAHNKQPAVTTAAPITLENNQANQPPLDTNQITIPTNNPKRITQSHSLFDRNFKTKTPLTTLLQYGDEHVRTERKKSSNAAAQITTNTMTTPSNSSTHGSRQTSNPPSAQRPSKKLPNETHGERQFNSLNTSFSILQSHQSSSEDLDRPIPTPPNSQQLINDEELKKHKTALDQQVNAIEKDGIILIYTPTPNNNPTLFNPSKETNEKPSNQKVENWLQNLLPWPFK